MESRLLTDDGRKVADAEAVRRYRTQLNLWYLGTGEEPLKIHEYISRCREEAQDTKSVKAILKIIHPYLDKICGLSHPLSGLDYCQACLMRKALKRGIE